MRITRETLLRIAKETAIKQSLSDPGLIAAYLTGSVLTADPFLGGSTDIDLVCVHAEPPTLLREIIAVTPEIHLDITHAFQGDYRNPKELRIHPRLGPELYNPLWLYEPRHFLEFVQAAVRTRYHDSANVLARSRRNSQAARQGWMEMNTLSVEDPQWLQQFLDVVALAANAVALLDGTPLSERRFMLQFPPHALAAGRPGLSQALFDLLGASRMDAASLGELLPAWEKDFQNAIGRPQVDASIAAPRLAYYKLGFSSILDSAVPQAVLWPLLHTWTLVSISLPAGLHARWKECCEKAGLDAPQHAQRLKELDSFLDEIEDLLDRTAAGNGM